MTKYLDEALIDSGYREMQSTGEDIGYRIYYENIRTIVNTVIFVDAKAFKDNLLKSFKESMNKEMERLNLSPHYFSVICVDSKSEDYVEEMGVARQLCAEDSFSWIYDEAQKQLIIYEGQTEDFYGLKGILERAELYIDKEKTEEEIEEKKKSFKDFFTGIKNLPRATTALILINILVYIICTFTGTLLYNKGGVGIKLIDGTGEWYRIFSSMFLHADITHIFSNMVLLYFLGEIVEREIKPVRFLIIYFLSGIGGCIATFISEILTGEYVVIIGASGAVFGIMGGLLALVLFKKINRKTMHLSRVLLVIVFSVYEGFTQVNVANYAHIGGVLTGFVAGVVFCLVHSNQKGKGNVNED